MIIFLLILCVLGFAYTNVFGRKVWHKFCMVIFGLGFLASLSLIVLNDKDHFGMTEVTQDKTFELKAVVQAKMAPTCYCTSRWAMVPKKFIYITHQIKRNYKNRNGKRHKHGSKRCSKATLVKNDEMVLSRVLGQNTIWPC